MTAPAVPAPERFRTKDGRTFEDVAADANVAPGWLADFLRKEITRRTGFSWTPYIRREVGA